MSRTKNKHQLYEDFILNLVNAPTPEDAMIGLIEGMRKCFNFSANFVKVEKDKIGLQYQSGFLGWLNSSIDNLKSILDKIIDKKNLYKVKEFQPYLDKYNKSFSTELTIETNGSLTEASPLIEENFIWEFYRHAINYCLIQLLRSPQSRELLFKCNYCKEYFISTRKRKDGERIFCKSKCRRDWHNHERIKSGANKAYKRKKRKEGAPESYYG